MLSIMFASILAVLTFYGAPLAIFRNRLAAGLWGVLLGVPAAVATAARMYGDPPRGD